LLEHDVEAKNGETHIVLHVVWLEGAVVVRHGGGSRDERLYDNALHITSELLMVFASALELVPEPLDVPFVAFAHLRLVIRALILLEVGRVLVDGLVSEMHAQVLDVVLFRRFLLLSG